MVVDDAAMEKLIGNAMSVNVIERLLRNIFRHIGALSHDCTDRWADGTALAELTNTGGDKKIIILCDFFKKPHTKRAENFKRKPDLLNKSNQKSLKAVCFLQQGSDHSKRKPIP